MSFNQRRSIPYLLLENVNSTKESTPNGRRVPHLQTSRDTPPPRRHTWLPTRIQVLNPHGDEAIQDPVPLWLGESTITLEPDSLDGGSPQEILVVEVIHGVVEIRITLPIQTVDDTGILGVGIDDVGARDVHLGDTIGVLGDARHGNVKMGR